MTTCVLDVGCGDNPIWAPVSAPGEITYYGTDIDQGALERAQMEHPNAKFIAGAGEHMPWFADESIDAITCRVALPLMDPPSALREMARVLRPGGTITLQLHSLRFACADLLRRVRAGKPKAVVGGVWALFNGCVFWLSGSFCPRPAWKQTLPRFVANGRLDSPGPSPGWHCLGQTCGKPRIHCLGPQGIEEETRDVRAVNSRVRANHNSHSGRCSSPRCLA